MLKTSNQQDQTSLLEAEQDKVGKSRGNLLHSHSAGESHMHTHLSPSPHLSPSQPHLTEYLAASSTLVSKLQLESSSLQRSVSDLQTQLSQVLQDRDSHCTQFSSLERLVEGTGLAEPLHLDLFI